MDFTLNSLAVKELKPHERPTEDIADARHRSMMDAIAPYAKPTVQKNLTPVYVDYKTRNTKLVLVLCPEWSPYMPPFSLARLSGVAKSAGYETYIKDLNVIAYRAFRDDWWPNHKIPFRLWDPSASWHWLGDTYMRDIHPLLEPILSSAVDEILSKNPDVVGFSVYYISEEPTKWMCQEIKRRAPHVKIAVGGPNVHKSWFKVEPYYDYVVVGEGEVNLLKLLEDVENKTVRNEPLILNQPEDERLNINGLPMPDYESIDFSLYDLPNGVNSEISRGCTAKCTFCEETHFWKYRQRQAVDLVTEVEWLYYNKGTDIIWFIDSLINGNLKELRAFALALKAKGLKVRWTGYARCDGRMDLQYLQDLADGGCIMFNFGCESGSQTVLDDMAKGVTVQEMEQNFIDCKKVGIWAATNWIVGFPTETLQDYADTMSFMWRMRNNNINNAGLGVGYGLGPETIVGQNPHKFNVSWHKYQGFWISNDFAKGGMHVMTRVKTIHMWLDMFKDKTEVPISYPIRSNLEKEHYKITFDNPDLCKEIEYEKFDYEIIKPDINPYADALVNEMWPFFRMLWKIRGGYTAEVYFNPDIDTKEFGTSYGPLAYWATFKFKISDDGKWEADFKWKFEQIDNPLDDRPPPPEGRKGAFYAQDYSRIQANTAKRARKLAKPEWDQEEGRSGQDFSDLLNEEFALNSCVDFSFEYEFVGKGDWGNYADYHVAVSDVKREEIPEKQAYSSNETMSVPSITSKPNVENVAVIPLTEIKRLRRPVFPV
jgi:Radical SAM superfamily/B12 binding domain